MILRQKNLKQNLIMIIATLILTNSFLFFPEKVAIARTKNNTDSKNNKVVFGVISDTHIAPKKSNEISRLTKAFEFFNKQKTDAIAVVGDLTDSGKKIDYDIWNSIKKSTVDNIKLVASMGNHEKDTADLFTHATGDKPNANYVINGYHFITLSPGTGPLDSSTGRGQTQGGADYSYVTNWLKTQLDSAVKEDPKKPIFVFFHHPMENTYYTTSDCHGSGLSTGKDNSFNSVFSHYPQVVAFSGHTHAPNNNPTSIWQDGGFTAINTSTLSYAGLENGMNSGDRNPNDGNLVAQAMTVEVNGSKILIHNYNLITDKYIPETWEFDVSSPSSFIYTSARKEKAKLPVFNHNNITINNITDCDATINFKQATAPPNDIGDIVESYRFDVINKKTGKLTSFKNWSKYYLDPVPDSISQNIYLLEPSTEYIVKVYAIDAYSKVSESNLAITFTTHRSNSINTTPIIYFNVVVLIICFAYLLIKRFRKDGKEHINS